MPASEPEGADPRLVDVTDAGLVVAASTDRPLDVTFDGRRILSLWTLRDTVVHDAGRFYPWPRVLAPFLDGSTTLALVDPGTGKTLAEQSVTLGAGAGRIAVADREGRPLGLDKDHRLSRLFGDRSAEMMAPVLDAMRTVLAALREAGVEPFLAYGTLLGAVREGNMIGHDSDTDLGYVSRWEHPADAARESYVLQRRIAAQGFGTRRYSGLAFKVIVHEADGSTRGLDVFGGFMRDGMLYLMGEVGHPFRPEWIRPLSTAPLAGEEFPVPAKPEHLLEAMYGPGWRTPDPAFKFTTPASTVRRLNGWFRGTRGNLDKRWEARRNKTEPHRPRKASGFSAQVLRETAPDALVVDLGCGIGSDALRYSRRGRRTIGLDFFPPDLAVARRRARHAGVDARFEWLNLNDLRAVVAVTTGLSREPGPRHVTARHVLDVVDLEARRNLLRLARSLTRDTGALHLEVSTRPAWVVEQLAAEIAEAGGTIRSTEEGPAPDGDGDGRAAPTTRMVVTWSR